MMNRKNKLLLAVLTSLFVLFPVFTAAQERQIHDDEVQTCEVGLAYQDVVLNDTIERTKDGGVLIVILRLGDRENSLALMRRRIYRIRQYLMLRDSLRRLKSEQVIIAEGERVKGLGQVEYYLDGKLHERLLFPRNGYLCHSVT